MSTPALMIGSSCGGQVSIPNLLKKINLNEIITLICPHIRQEAIKSEIERIGLKLEKTDKISMFETGKIYDVSRQFIYSHSGKGMMTGDKESPGLIKEMSLYVNLTNKGLNMPGPIDKQMGVASEIYKENLIGVILSGKGKDGAKGIKIIEQQGGVTFAQRYELKETLYDGTSLYCDEMPTAAKNAGAQFYMNLSDISEKINTIVKDKLNF